MAKNWFVIRDGKTSQPISAGELKRLAEAGELQPDEMVRREDREEPLTARKVEGLFPAPPLEPTPKPAAGPIPAGGGPQNAPAAINHPGNAVASGIAAVAVVALSWLAGWGWFFFFLPLLLLLIWCGVQGARTWRNQGDVTDPRNYLLMADATLAAEGDGSQLPKVTLGCGGLTFATLTLLCCGGLLGGWEDKEAAVAAGAGRVENGGGQPGGANMADWDQREFHLSSWDDSFEQIEEQESHVFEGPHAFDKIQIQV